MLADQPEFPVVSLSLADGEAVQDLLVDSEIEASIKLTLENLPSQNVIAQKPGASDAVVVGGSNIIVVKVVNQAHNGLGCGGITGPAMLWAPQQMDTWSGNPGS